MSHTKQERRLLLLLSIYHFNGGKQRHGHPWTIQDVVATISASSASQPRNGQQLMQYGHLQGPEVSVGCDITLFSFCDNYSAHVTSV